MHQTWAPDIGEIVECYCAPANFYLDTPDGPLIVTEGTWLMGVVWSPAYWEKVKAGEITGLSMGGTGRRVDLPVGVEPEASGGA